MKAIPDLLLPIIVLGGIYAGIYSPTEAAAVGVVYALILSVVFHRSLSIKQLPEILIESAKTTAMLLTIVVGALVFGSALTLVGLSDLLGTWISGMDVSPWVVLLAMNLIWLVMGFFLEVVSILLITTPIFFPIIMSLGYDPVWFGILMMINMELSGNYTSSWNEFICFKNACTRRINGTDYKGGGPFNSNCCSGISLSLAIPRYSNWYFVSELVIKKYLILCESIFILQ